MTYISYSVNTFNRALCGGNNFPEKVCAAPGSYTQVYLDDTDNSAGGCHMAWGLETTDPSYPYPPWFRDLRICFHWEEQPGAKDICHGIVRSICVKVGEYTPDYIDSSDDRIGNSKSGCIMSWKIQVPENADSWAKTLMFCVKFEASINYDGNDKRQCGFHNKNRYCAKANKWTQMFHDVTNQTPGGCKMQWSIGFT
uniref:Uncharacterized protein n=1 Tax=Strigamia maritima TaxID=126957 RepID=T1ISK0_STRMM